jgi:hypothetical protein
MAGYNTATLAKARQWSKDASGNPTSVEFLAIMKVGAAMVDFTDLSAVQMAMANGNRTEASFTERNGTGGIPMITDGAQCSLTFNAEDLVSNAELANLLNKHRGRFGLAVIYGDCKVEHLLDEKTQSKYISVAYKVSPVGENSKTSTHRWSGTATWVNVVIGKWGEASLDVINTPAPPVQAAATLVDADSADLNWTKVDGATTYHIDVATDLAFANKITGWDDNDVGDVATVTVGSLSASTSYFARIRSVNGAGESISSNVIQFTTTA